MPMPKLTCDGETGRPRSNDDGVRFALAVTEHRRPDSLIHGYPR